MREEKEDGGKVPQSFGLCMPRRSIAGPMRAKAVLVAHLASVHTAGLWTARAGAAAAAAAPRGGRLVEVVEGEGARGGAGLAMARPATLPTSTPTLGGRGIILKAGKSPGRDAPRARGGRGGGGGRRGERLLVTPSKHHRQKESRCRVFYVFWFGDGAMNRDGDDRR